MVEMGVALHGPVHGLDAPEHELSGGMGACTGCGVAGAAGAPGRWFQVGDVLSDVYEIRGLVGTGEVGRVYEAYDRLLDRLVTIRTAERNGVAERLCAEARVLASMHASLGIDVYAMGCHEGIEYMVMERLFGLTLRDRMLASLERWPFGPAEMLHILSSVAWSLAAAHRDGVFHHWLAPERIMVEAGNRVMLLAADRDGSMHPRESGPAADIYGLGALAFELINGRPPRSRERVEMQVEMTMREMLAGQHAGLAVHLGRLVGEMLAADPARRPGDAAMIALWFRALGQACERAPA